MEVVDLEVVAVVESVVVQVKVEDLELVVV